MLDGSKLSLGLTSSTEVAMSIAMLSKMHMNGYDVVSVNSGPWRVCTPHDRYGTFATREEALAFAASLPGYKARLQGRAPRAVNTQ